MSTDHGNSGPWKLRPHMAINIEVLNVISAHVLDVQQLDCAPTIAVVHMQ